MVSCTCVDIKLALVDPFRCSLKVLFFELIDAYADQAISGCSFNNLGLISRLWCSLDFNLGVPVVEATSELKAHGIHR
jgi:hypothetical protein